MCVCVCVYAQSFSHVRLYVTLWTVTHQPPLSVRFSRQEYGSGLPFPPPGESSRPRDQTHFQTKLACFSCFSCVGRQILYHWATWEAPKWNIYLIPNIWLNKSVIPLALRIYEFSSLFHKNVRVHAPTSLLLEDIFLQSALTHSYQPWPLTWPSIPHSLRFPVVLYTHSLTPEFLCVHLL